MTDRLTHRTFEEAGIADKSATEIYEAIHDNVATSRICATTNSASRCAPRRSSISLGVFVAAFRQWCRRPAELLEMTLDLTDEETRALLNFPG
jgi:hypothetical protein